MDKLTAKVGPLPAWVWGVLALGIGYLAYRHYSGSSGSGAPATTVGSTGAATGAVDPGTASDSGNYSADPGVDNSSSSGAVDGTTIIHPGQFTDDGEWSAYAAMHLQATGADPVAVSNALNNYLSGTQLTLAQAALIKLAVTAYGYPPGGVYPINVVGSPLAPAPTTTTGHTTTPPPVHTTPNHPAPVSTALPAPGAPHLSALGNGTVIEAETDAVPGAHSYIWASGTGVPLATSTVPSHQFHGRTPGRKYTIKVRAVNGTHKSAWSGTSACTMPKGHAVSGAPAEPVSTPHYVHPPVPLT